MKHIYISSDAVPNIRFYHHAKRYEENFADRVLNSFTWLITDAGAWCIGDSDSDYKVNPGEGLLLLPNDPHYMKLMNPGHLHKHYCAHFTIDGKWFVKDDCDTFILPQYNGEKASFTNLTDEFIVIPQYFKPHNFQYLTELSNIMLQQWKSERYYSKKQTGFTLINILIEISRDYLENLNPSKSHSNSKSQRLVEHCLSYIDQYFMKSIQVSDLAVELNVTSSYLGTVFSKYTGINIQNYINKVRIERAKNFITDTSLSLKKIASECGFKDIYYFSKIFKKVTGFTATEYISMVKPIRRPGLSLIE